MDREQLARDLQAIAQALDDRVEIWIDVIEMDGSVGQRIYQGSFVSPSYSRKRQPITEERHDDPRSRRAFEESE